MVSHHQQQLRYRFHAVSLHLVDEEIQCNSSRAVFPPGEIVVVWE